MESSIKKILSKFITDSKLVNLLVNRSNISYWEKSLTHESINIKENYEKYEFFGDGSLGLAFNVYLVRHRNIVDISVINNLNNFYMAKKYQPTISRKLGLDKLVISGIPVTDDILEDTTEAFFGVFTFICRKIWQKYPDVIKSPIEYIVDFFVWYFDTMDSLDLNKKKDLVAKTFFNNFYYFFSGDSPKIKPSWFYNTKSKSFYFKEKFINQIGLYSKDLQKITREILTRKGYSSEDQYLDQVTEKFKELGFDSDWLKNEIQNISFDEPYKTLAKDKGYNRFILEKNKNRSYNLLAQKNDPITRESISEVLLVFNSDKDIFTIREESKKFLDKFFN